MRNLVRQRADNRVLSPRQQHSPLTHHIEHIVAKRHTGSGDIENLALAWHRRRRHGPARYLGLQIIDYARSMLRYHVAFFLPRGSERMVVAEALDFPGAVSQGFDLADARLMIASALGDLAQLLVEEGKPLPMPDPDCSAPDADLIELIPLSIEVGTSRP